MLAAGFAASSPQKAAAQLATSPEIALPEVEVVADQEAEKAAKKKAPAAAQQSSTPRASSAPGEVDKSAIAVSPSGIAAPVDQVSSSVTVITSKEIEAQQRRTLPDVLKTVPGLNVVQTGGPGGQTSIFMRGTNSNHVKVIIDGVDASDPSVTNRAFDFGQMLTGDIERIEVLRGPQSGLYGADAVGGVIVIYTKKGEGPPKLVAAAEGGSFGTFNQRVGASGSTGRLNYAFNIQHYRADEVPVTPRYAAPPSGERFDNSTDNWTYSTKLGYDLTQDLTVNFMARYTQSNLWFTGDDTMAFPTFANPFQSRTDMDQFLTRGEAVWKTWGGNLVSYFGVNYSEQKTDTYFPGYAFNDGDRIKYDWRSVAQVAPGYTFVVGAEYQTESMLTDTTDAEESNTGAFVELQSEIVRNFFLVANARLDDNENFGEHYTWRVAPAYVIEATGTKLHASVGTAFKAPTLSQRFVDFPMFNSYGNPDLLPEESLGYEAGFEQSVFGDTVRFGATYFHNDITELIESYFDGMGFTYRNIGRAKTEGVEVFASADITDDLRVRADYTYTEAKNDVTGADLLRRPKNKASITAGWTPTEPLLLTATLLYVGESADIDRLFFSNVTLPAYTLVNVAADYKVNDGMALYGRIDNLFDEHYENPDGFMGTGFGVFAGVRFMN